MKRRAARFLLRGAWCSTGLDLNGVFRFVFVLCFVFFCLFSCTFLPKRKTKRNPKSSKTAFRSSPELLMMKLVKLVSRSHACTTAAKDKEKENT